MNPNAHLYRTLTWPEVREAAERGAVITIPVAAIEQHGPHLPIDTDNVLVEHVTEEAARRSNGGMLTAPMIHYGFNEHTWAFPGRSPFGRPCLSTTAMTWPSRLCGRDSIALCS